MKPEIFSSQSTGMEAIVFGELQSADCTYVYLHGSGEFGRGPDAHFEFPGFATALVNDEIILKHPFVIPCCEKAKKWEPEMVRLFLVDLRMFNKKICIDLIGYSRGGAGVYEYISIFSDIRTATVISSKVPRLSGFNTSVPLLIVHGSLDDNEDIDKVRKFYKDLKLTANTRMDILELEGDHFIIDDVAKNTKLYDWISSAG